MPCAWLDRSISDRTRRFAKWPAICSFALGMAGQAACHLMAQAGMARAPWPVTTIVSCLPVLVLGTGTALAHMLRADAKATQAPDSGTGPPATLRSSSWSVEDQNGPDRGRPEAGRDRTPRRDQNAPTPGPQHGQRPGDLARGLPSHKVDQARVVARRLAATGQPVTRRALRSGGVRGSTVISSRFSGVYHVGDGPPSHVVDTVIWCGCPRRTGSGVTRVTCASPLVAAAFLFRAEGQIAPCGHVHDTEPQVTTTIRRNARDNVGGPERPSAHDQC